MQINLTKPEFVILLRMANIGDWGMHADLEGDEHDDPEVQAHRKVLQKLFAAADKAKLEGIVRYEKKFGEYFETHDFEEDCHAFIVEWEGGRFREMLADRLAQRDLVEEIGEETYMGMDRIERGGRLCELAACYENEFVEHGLDRLHLLNVDKGDEA